MTIVSDQDRTEDVDHPPPPDRRAMVVMIALAMSLLSIPIRRPLILPDESGFILNALHLGAGKPPSGLGYYPGYSLLLAPITSFTTSMTSLAVATQIINAALTVATALLARSLAKTLTPDRPDWMHSGIGLVVASYPAYRVFAALALSENLMVPAVLGLCLLLLRAVQRPSDDLAAALFAVSGGLAYAIHARAIVVPIACVIAITLVFRGRQRLAGLVALGAGCLAAFIFVEAALSASGIVNVDSDARDTLSGLIRANLTGSALRTLPLTALGQVYYLVVATAGLLVPAVWCLGRASWPSSDAATASTDSESDDPAVLEIERLRSLSTFLVPLAAGTLAVSSLFLNEQQGDQAIYGRYNEGVLAPLLVIGALQLVSRTIEAQRTLRVAALFVPLAAVVLVITRGAETFDGRQQLLNITGVFPVVERVGAITLSSITLFGVAFIAIIAIAGGRQPRLGLGLLFVAFLSIAAIDISRAARAIEVLDQEDDLVATLHDLDRENPIGCVGLDQSELTERWHQENYRLRLPEIDFEHFFSSVEGAPCSDLVISARTDLQGTIPGAKLLGVEPRGRLMLWVLPGARLDELKNQGVPLFDDPTIALPDDQRASLSIRIDDDLDVGPGQTVRGSVIITNQGPAPFLPELALPDLTGSVNLGLEWRLIEAPTERLFEPTRVRIPRLIAPGDVVEVPFVIRATTPAGRLEPGAYLLHAELVQELVRWTDLSSQLVVEVTSEGF